jgi:S-adenosylmethionine decarboxylase
VLAHLDKSHITVHTYPESHPEMGVSTFRADIDVATCGEISPLKSLNYLIQSFDSDIMTIDYKVRGFTRMSNGTKVFVDHDFDSIQDYIDPSLLRNYNAFDVNVNQHNMFHTRMMIRDINLNNYLFGKTMEDLSVDKTQYLENTLVREMKEIYFGQTLYQ